MIMCVRNIFDRVGLEEEVIWHLKDIEKSLTKKGTKSSKLIGIPLPEIKISWQQNKQGKGKSKAEKDLSLNNLVGFQQNGCIVCMVEAAEKELEALVDTVGEIQQDGSVLLGSWTKFPDGCELQ
jgi:hypothetical protein